VYDREGNALVNLAEVPAGSPGMAAIHAEAGQTYYLVVSGTNSSKGAYQVKASTGDAVPLRIYVSPDGNDEWSGRSPALGDSNGPFTTLERARDEIRRLRGLGQLVGVPVEVCMRGGTYSFAETFELTAEDTSTADAPVTYQSYPGETAVLSGAASLSLQWSPYKDGIYVADVGPMAFNSLFVDGHTATRAREPDVGYYTIASVDPATDCTAFRFSGDDIDPNWTNLQDVEVVSLRQWNQSRFRIDSVVGDSVTFQGSLRQDFGYDWDYNPSKSRYYVENVFEGLDTPG
jgi:hypothetical protein